MWCAPYVVGSMWWGVQSSRLESDWRVAVGQLRWSKKRKIDALRGVGLLAACTRRELAAVADVAVPAELPAGSVLTREGQVGALAYVIETGVCDVLRNGRRIVRLGPGALVGELSLLDGGPRTATVQAATDVHALEISQGDLERLLRRAPNLRRAVLCSLAERVRDVDSRAGLVS